MGEGADSTLYSYVWNDPTGMIDPFGLWGGFVFSTGTASQGGITTEGITVAGWDSSTGFYSEQISASGFDVGSKAFNVGLFRGTAATKSGNCPSKTDGITLLEGNLALAGSGAFLTDSGEAGPYVHAGIGDGTHASLSVGAGVTLPQGVSDAIGSALTTAPSPSSGGWDGERSD